MEIKDRRTSGGWEERRRGGEEGRGWRGESTDGEMHGVWYKLHLALFELSGSQI